MTDCGTRAKVFLISCLLGTGQALMNEGFAKVFGSVGSVTNVRTTQLLNQLCNESQKDGDTIQRDACYGCFFRSSQQPSGYPMLLSMATCADLYLNNTDYGHCRAYLRNATSTVNSRTSSTIIYCTFLECIRQVNKDSLNDPGNTVHNAQEALTALSREVNRRPREAKFVARKTKSALILKQYLFALRGVCIARRIDTDSNTIRPGAEPISPRHNDYIDSFVRRRGDKNVFEFYINGRLPRTAFRQYNSVYPSEDAMFPHEPDYRGISSRRGHYE